MLTILFVLVLAFVVWVTLKPSWLPKPPENQVTASISKNADKASQASKSVAEKTGGWFKHIKVPFQKQPSLGQQLKTWASQAETGQAELSAWLMGLSDEAASQLSDELAAFCQSQHLELAWLFDEKTEVELRTGLEELVILYSQAVFKGRSAQPLAALQRWQAAPLQPENRNFARQLYTRLVSAGLVSVPGDLLLASDQERTNHVTQAIQSMMVENRAAVLGLLGEIVVEEEPVQAEPSKPQKKAKKSAAMQKVEQQLNIVPATIEA